MGGGGCIYLIGFIIIAGVGVVATTADATEASYVMSPRQQYPQLHITF